MSYTLGEAAKATGRSKATIHRAIQSSKISATKDEATGAWKIDPAELHRVFPPVTLGQAQNGDLRQSEKASETAMLHTQLAQERQERERERLDKDGVIDDLRRRLDDSEDERRKVQTQLTALLTDQRAKAPDVIAMPPPPGHTLSGSEFEAPGKVAGNGRAPAAMKAPPTPQRKGWRKLFG